MSAPDTLIEREVAEKPVKAWRTTIWARRSDLSYGDAWQWAADTGGTAQNVADRLLLTASMWGDEYEFAMTPFVASQNIIIGARAAHATLPGKDWNEGRDAAAKHLNDIADEERTQAELRGDAKSYGAAAVHQDRAFALDIYAKAIRSLSRTEGGK